MTTESGDGCSSTDSITVYVPEIGDAGDIATAASTTICAGDVIAGNITSTTTASLSAGSSTATIEYEWQYSSATTPTWTKIPGSTDSSTLATNTLSTFRIYEDLKIRRLARAVRGGVKCDYDNVSPEISIQIADERNVSITANGANRYCTDQDLTYTAGGLQVGDSFIWKLNGTTISSGTLIAPSTSILISSSDTVIGLNTLEFEYAPVSTTCSNTSTVTFTIVDPPNISLTTDSPFDTYCDNETVTINAIGGDPGATYQWQIGSTPSTTLVSQIQFSSTSLLSTDTTIILTYTDGVTGCSTTASVTISKVGEKSGSDTISPTRTTFCNDEIPTPIIGTNTITSTNPAASISYYWEATTNALANFTTNTVSITSNTQSLTFSSPLASNTWFRRVSVLELNGIECLYYSDPVQYTIQNLDGGTIDDDEKYTCDLTGATYRILVTDNNFGPTTQYQWQVSSSVLSSTFTNISSNASSSFYDITLSTVTQTTYYRRITSSSDSTACSSTEYSNVFTLYLNSIEPGTLTDYSGRYCYGSVPPVLGASSVVTSTFPVEYQWYIAETNDLTNVTSRSWTAITSATQNSYITPPLDSSRRFVLYRRGVTINDGSADPCERYTDNIVFEILPPIDTGYVDIEGGTPDFPYCIGDKFPDLRLISGDNFRILDNDNYTITATWERSTDGLTWTTINEPVNDNNETTFNTRIEDSNAPGDNFYMLNDVFIRVKIVDQGSPNTVSNTDLTHNSIRLIPTDTVSESLDLNEVYSITIGTFTVSSVVTAANSTTDIIGEELATKIDNEIPDYSATFYPNSNIITIEDQMSNGFEVNTRVYFTVGQSLFMNVLEQVNGASECVYYTAVKKLR